MKIISVDVGWQQATRRNAVAVASPAGEVIFLARCLGDNELIELAAQHTEPSSIILLDVPIEGCENLSGHWRPVEKALQHHISLYPTSQTKDKETNMWRVSQLKRALHEAIPNDRSSSVAIHEIYPHAVYKFLWFAKHKGKLARVRHGEWQPGKFESREFSSRLFYCRLKTSD